MRARRLAAGGVVAAALLVPALSTAAANASEPLVADSAAIQPIDEVPPVVTGSAVVDGVLGSWGHVVPYLMAGRWGCAVLAAAGSSYACGG
ncbi:hypothetical protein [Nocardia transvalensis]|uniref:hypothetical protein n=1 Tax=Nocardia transvalensis TaxID=37333 RepID=UPI001895F5D4|nr:hypothetical protein [Nocardia transvalensis]MBF6327070.1 hypothetical protein [Nocardia transvalensis]